MIPTKAQVLAAARFHLGDDQVAAGQVFTDVKLEQPFNLAYRELFRALQGLSSPRVRRIAYYNLPAYTSVLVPSTAFITDMGEIELIEERGGVSAASITGAIASPGAVAVGAPGHTFETGDRAVIYGVQGMTGLSGMFVVTKIDANTFVANGAVGIGAYVSGGTASESGEQFTPLIPLTTIVSDSGGGVLGSFAWYEDVLHFPLCTGLRQLRITYISSAGIIASVDDTTGVDDSLDFLATRTAGIAAASRGAAQRSQMLNGIALGPTGQADGSGGILRELVAQTVRAMQNNPVRRPPFRARRPDIDFL